jgi:hypothetical protein
MAGLLVMGGVALDHDMWFLKPISDVFLERPLLLAESWRTPDGGGIAGEFVMGCHPRDPWLYNVLDQFCDVKSQPGGTITANIESHRRRDCLHAWPMEYFCPHHRRQPEKRYHTTGNTVAIHLFRQIEYDWPTLESLAGMRAAA